MRKLLSITLTSALLVLSSCGDASENAPKDAKASRKTSKNATDNATNNAKASYETSTIAPSDNSEKKSFCDCIEIANQYPKSNATPTGCEWLNELTAAEQEYEMRNAINDCPDNFPEGMLDMLMEEMNDMEEMDDMDDMDDMGDYESEM